LKLRAKFCLVGLFCFVIGCGNGLSNDFSKSGRYAFILVKKATQHESVLEHDVTNAYAQAEADAKSDADKETLQLLNYYLSAFRINDGTPSAENYVKGCEHSLNKIFDDHAEPKSAGKECTDALNAKADEIMKQGDAGKQKPGSEKK
jgi:hypothetical protein